MFDKSTRSKQVCQLLLSLIVEAVALGNKIGRLTTIKGISKQI